jgi:hypothetical protein
VWAASIVVVAWPLELARPLIGDLSYVGLSLVVLVIGFLLGKVVATGFGKRRE